MKRGEIWTVAGGGDFAGKPRPAVIVQDDRFESTQSITICMFTTSLREASFLRIPVAPDERNGLDRPSSIMVERVTSVGRQKLGLQIGVLDPVKLVRLNEALIVFLGLAGRTRP
ncbi:MAG: type II toxin-antitoxin system PemK/MazF family toxin [Dehalococcoidia bacterium]